MRWHCLASVLEYQSYLVLNDANDKQTIERSLPRHGARSFLRDNFSPLLTLTLNESSCGTRAVWALIDVWGCGHVRSCGCLVKHLGGNALDRNHGAILTGLAGVHGHDHVLSRDNLAEHRVLGRGGSVEEVQEAVVDSVDEELRSTRIGLAGVGHGQSERLVGQLGAAGVAELVRDRATRIALDGLLATWVCGAWCRAASAGFGGVSVLGVGAAELNHEVRDRAVNMHTIVEASLNKVDEVGCSDRHLVGENLNHDLTGGELELSLSGHGYWKWQ